MSDADAYEVKCPCCGAKKGQPCTYIQPKTLPKYTHTDKHQQALSRVGQPTKMPHNDRRNAAFAKRTRDRLRAVEAERAESHRERDAILRANADAVQEETHQLAAWLRKNAHIFSPTDV